MTGTTAPTLVTRAQRNSRQTRLAHPRCGVKKLGPAVVAIAPEGGAVGDHHHAGVENAHQREERRDGEQAHVAEHRERHDQRHHADGEQDLGVAGQKNVVVRHPNVKDLFRHVPRGKGSVGN